MRKYRIKVIKWGNRTEYYPQYRDVLFWNNYYLDSENGRIETLHYDSEYEAIEYLNSQRENDKLSVSYIYPYENETGKRDR